MYLFVGLAQTVLCAEKAVALTRTMSSAVSSSEIDENDAPDNATIICDHCQFCFPGLTANSIVAEAPVVTTAELGVAMAQLVRSGPHRLDTPPPKNLI